MVNYMLEIKAELENLTDLQPQGGCDDENFRYHFKLKCGYCGEITQKEAYVRLVETVNLPTGKGCTHLIQKCKFCSRVGTVTMITGRGRPLTHADSEAGKFAPLMLFECRGFEPLDYVFLGEWEAESLAGRIYGRINLCADDGFSKYDVKGGCRVRIKNPIATFTTLSNENDSDVCQHYSSVLVRVRPAFSQENCWEINRKRLTCLKEDFQIAADLAFSRCGEIHVMNWLQRFIHPVFDGFNANIITFGQKDTGKSFTMKRIRERAIDLIYRHNQKFAIKVRAYKIFQEPGNLVTDLLDKCHNRVVDPGDVKAKNIGSREEFLALLKVSTKDKEKKAHKVIHLDIETDTIYGTFSLIDLVDDGTSMVTLSKILGQGFREDNGTYEVPEEFRMLMKCLKGLTQQNEINSVIFCVSPHFEDLTRSIDLLSLAKNYIKLPTLVRRNRKVVSTTKAKSLASGSPKGSMLTFWTKRDDELLMEKAREFPSQWETISLILDRTALACLSRYRILKAGQPNQLEIAIDFSGDEFDEAF